MKILIVEDEPKVASFLKQGLEENNNEVDLAYDGQTGLKLALRKDYEIILLDLILPHMSGIDVCRKVKESKPHTPVLMLTALGTTDDKVAGFDAGADDYLVKPFEFKELMARIRALTKRGQLIKGADNKLKVADLELDLDKKEALRGGKTIDLTAKEFALLEYLMRNKGRVVSRVDIAEKVWDINFDMGTNVIDVYVNILRKKIDKQADVRLIHTKIGMGYILKDE